MKVHLALLCLCSTVWATTKPISIPDCLLAATGGYSYPPPEVQLSVKPAIPQYKAPLSLSGSSGSDYGTKSSSGYYYENQAKEGGITYADQQLKTSALAPPLQISKPVLLPPKLEPISNAYLPPAPTVETQPALTKTYSFQPNLKYIAPALRKSSTYESSEYSYSQSSPTISKSPAYVAPSLAYGQPYTQPKLTNGLTVTAIQKLDENYLLGDKLAIPLGSYSYAPSLSGSYLSSDYKLGGSVSTQYASKPLQPISYKAPVVTKGYAVPTGTSYIAPALRPEVESSVKYSSGGALTQQYISKPLPAVSYASPSFAKVSTISAPSYQYAAGSSGSQSSYKYASGSGAISHQYVSKPLQSVSYAPAAVAPYVAPALTQYASGYGASSGTSSHQYISKPVQPYVAPALTKVASITPVGTQYTAGGSSLKYTGGSGAVSHQYISKPLQTVSYAPATPVAKVASFEAPSYTQYSSSSGYGASGAVSHQHVSKPIQPLLQTYSAPAITKIAAVAPVATQYASGGSLKYAGGSGAVSHQYISKPGGTVGYAAPVTKVATAVLPAVSKVESYDAPSHTAYASGHGISGGAISYQHVAKPLQTVSYAPAAPVAKVATLDAPSYIKYTSNSGYASSPPAPAITKIAAVAPSITQYATGSQYVKYAGGSGAASHQYISKPVQTVSYAPPPVAKVSAVAALPALSKVETYASSSQGLSSAHGISGSGAVSHQYVSKPLQSLLTKVAGVAAPAEAQYHSGATQFIKYEGGGAGAVSHQYISKPALALPAVTKVETYSAPAATHYLSAEGGESIKYASKGGGATSYQHVSKPAPIEVAKGYISPAIGFARSTTYPLSGDASSIHSSSGSSGAVSHQYTFKQPIVVGTPAIAKVATYSSPEISTSHSSGGAVSHQYSSLSAKSE
ncbi:uncharacterized protein Cpr76Bd isoform X2 [Eurosta solidaginis]|uniref:uncharacterized protein Cpr76Bd isoform X2 n=1 Tax=Eurosta solidaginis TaxID=178769 RepID=UPI0035305EB5